MPTSSNLPFLGLVSLLALHTSHHPDITGQLCQLILAESQKTRRRAHPTGPTSRRLATLPKTSLAPRAPLNTPRTARPMLDRRVSTLALSETFC